MREIKFRGKRVDNGEWIYGGIDIQNGEATIFDHDCVCHSAYDVDIDTVGQYTGLKDNNGKEIYEGDIVIYNETQYEVSEIYGSYALQRLDNDCLDYADFPLSIFPCGSDKMEFIGSKNDYCVSFYELADNQQDIDERLLCEVIGNIYENTELTGGA